MDNVDLTLEHDFRYGGAQRLASIIAKKLNKKLYYIGRGTHKLLCWDTKVNNKVPAKKYLLSLSVDKTTPITINGKVHIKFMHSFETIKVLNRFESAKNFIWITHRQRVYESARRLGYKVHLVPDGFILYDYKPHFETSLMNEKNDLLISISRIDRDNRIELPIKAANACLMPMSIIGTNKDHKYLDELKAIANDKIEFLGETTETEKVEALKKAKILLHATDGKFRDYLDYSMLDGMSYGCVPLCITPDKKQFEEIDRLGLGSVVGTHQEAVGAIKQIIDDYGYFQNNIKEFMGKFVRGQEGMLKRYVETIRCITETNW